MRNIILIILSAGIVLIAFSAMDIRDYFVRRFRRVKAVDGWSFSVPIKILDLLPEIFRDALSARLPLDDVHLNKSDDEGWLLTASHLGVSFRVLCRYQFVGDNAENVLWCEGVKKSVLGFFNKKQPPPPALISVIPFVLSDDIKADRIEAIAD